jgi:hypothetical protein
VSLEGDVEKLNKELESLRLEAARLSARIEGLQAERDALGTAVARQSKVPDNGENRSDLRRLTIGQAIVEVLRCSPEPMRIREIVDALTSAGRYANYSSVSVGLQVLLRQERVRRVDRGLYEVNSTSSPGSVANRSVQLGKILREGVIMERLPMGQVEKAVRNRVLVGAVLLTPTGRGRFTVAEIGNKGPVLLLGEKEARTLIPWTALEGVPGFLGTEAWSPIGGIYDQAADQTSLDGHMKRFVNRATAGWVASLLEDAGVIEIDRRPPARVRMKPGFSASGFDSEDADSSGGKAGSTVPPQPPPLGAPPRTEEPSESVNEASAPRSKKLPEDVRVRP